MTDESPAVAPAPAQDGPSFRVMAQYLRDLSFESPGAPDSLMSGERPGIDMSVELGAKPRGEDTYEIELRLSARALRGEVAVFHVDVQYCGVFQVVGLPPEMIEQVLLIECPRFLFPFARRIVSDVTADGAFPPFQIEPIDFVALYHARRAQAQGQAEGEVQPA